MSDRITLNAISNTVLADNQRTIARLATYQQQLSSGKRINQVSDDPVAARQALRYRTESLETGKFLDNISKGSSFIDATDSSIEQMSQVLDEAKQLAVQGATATQDANSRKALAQSVDSLLGRMVDLANTVHDGRYLFSGTATLTQPFARSADGKSVTYQGNLDSFDVKIGPNTSVTLNQDGYTLFQSQTDVFASLTKLRDALSSNDPTAVSGLIATVDQASAHINDLHGALGGREQRLTLAQNQLESAKVGLDDLTSKAEDVDFTDTISKMQLAQTALQAGLEAGAKVLKPSLLDYLT
jgi:flagellar hook-associated protein 3 FlgL